MLMKNSTLLMYCTLKKSKTIVFTCFLKRFLGILLGLTSTSGASDTILHEQLVMTEREVYFQIYFTVLYFCMTIFVPILGQG